MYYDKENSTITDIPLRYEKVANDIYDTLKNTKKYTDTIKTKTSEPIIHNLSTDYLNDFEEATLYLCNPNKTEYSYDKISTTSDFFLPDPERTKIINSNKNFIKFKFKSQKVKKIGGYNVEKLDLRLDLSRDIIYFDTTSDYTTSIKIDLMSSYDMESFKYDNAGIIKGVKYSNKSYYSDKYGRYYSGIYTKPYEYSFLKVLSEKDSKGNTRYYVTIPILYHGYDYSDADNNWHSKGILANAKKKKVKIYDSRTDSWIDNVEMTIEDAIGNINRNPIRVTLYKMKTGDNKTRVQESFYLGTGGISEENKNNDVIFINDNIAFINNNGLPTYTTENDLLMTPSRNKNSSATESIVDVKGYLDQFHTDYGDIKYSMASNNTGLHQVQTYSKGYYFNKDAAGNIDDSVSYRDISAIYNDLNITAEMFDGNTVRHEKNIKKITLSTNYVKKYYKSNVKFAEKDPNTGAMVDCGTLALTPDIIPNDAEGENNMEAIMNYNVAYFKLYLDVEETDVNISITKENLAGKPKTNLSNVIVKKSFVSGLPSRTINSNDPIKYTFENIYKLIPHALDASDKNSGGNMYAYALEFYIKTPVMLINQNMNDIKNTRGVSIKMYDLLYNTLYNNRYSVVDKTINDDDNTIKYSVYGGEEYTVPNTNAQTKSRTSEPDSTTEVTSNVNTKSTKHTVAIVPSQNDNIDNPDIIIRENVNISDADENRKITNMLDREATGAYKDDTNPCTFSSPDLESIEEHKSRIIESGLYNIFKFSSTTGACVGSSFYNDLKSANKSTLSALLYKENSIFNPSAAYTNNTIFEYYSRLNGMSNLLMPALLDEKEKQFISYSDTDNKIILSKERVDNTAETNKISNDRSFVSVSPYSRLLEYEKYPLNIIKNTTMNKLHSVETSVDSTGEKEYVANFFDEYIKNNNINYQTHCEKFSSVLADTLSNMYKYEHSKEGISRKQNIYNQYSEHYEKMFSNDKPDNYEKNEKDILNSRIEDVSEKMVFTVNDSNKKNVCANIISKLGEKYYSDNYEYRWVIL